MNELSRIINFYVTDCLSFNNERYYDFWALSIGDFEFSCWHWTLSQKIIIEMNKYLKEKFSKTNLYLECDSAFNGLAIYKYDVFKNYIYKTEIDDLSIFDFNKINNIKNKYGVEKKILLIIKFYLIIINY